MSQNGNGNGNGHEPPNGFGNFVPGKNGELLPRGPNGAFPPGNNAAPNGRGFAVTERKFNAMISAAVSDDDWKAVVATALREAKEGGALGAVARKWLSDHLCLNVEQQLKRGEREGKPMEITIVRTGSPWAAQDPPKKPS